MSLPEESRYEMQALQCLRVHRAQRAERRLRQALVALRALQARIEQARMQVEQTRQQEARQRAELLCRHQGQVVSLQTLIGWNEAQRKACADTDSEEQRLQLLLDQQHRDVIGIENARKHASQCQRAVEKLRELSVPWRHPDL